MSLAPFDVLHVDGERGLRGGERQLLYLACALRARGHRNVVVCRRGSPLAGEAAAAGLETAFAPFWGEWDPVTAWRLRVLCRAARRPVVHAHTAHAAAAAALCRALGGAPFVAHRRVDFPLRGGLSRRLKYDSAGRVVAVSQAIARVLAQDGLGDGKVEVVPDAFPSGERECAWAGLDAARFARPSTRQRLEARRALCAEWDLPEDGFWVGNLAALVPHKDHDTLVAAALIVLLKRPQARFFIAGEGPEGPRLIASVRKMGLGERILFLGQREPSALLKAIDAFALSSWGEGMGSVLLEAAACGVPIAATSAGGIPEIVEDARTGLLSSPRDAEALAGNLLRLEGDAALRARLSAAALENLGRFGLERLAARMEGVYGAVA